MTTRREAARRQPVHPRAQVDHRAVLLDLGAWGYVLADSSPTYGDGRWWPYTDPTARLSPDLELRAWRNEYVLLTTVPGTPHQITARLVLAAHAPDWGAVTVTARLLLDLREGTLALQPDDVTGELREQALEKGRRILVLIAAARAHRDGGRRFQNGRYQRRPITTHDLATARNRQHGEERARARRRAARDTRSAQ